MDKNKKSKREIVDPIDEINRLEAPDWEALDPYLIEAGPASCGSNINGDAEDEPFEPYEIEDPEEGFAPWVPGQRETHEYIEGRNSNNR